MNKSTAKSIAQIITNKQLQDMLESAKTNIKDWTVVSSINKGFTKGTSWNVLATDFDVNKQYHPIIKYNMIREFGEFLPESLKPKKKVKPTLNDPFHQDPIF